MTTVLSGASPCLPLDRALDSHKAADVHTHNPVFQRRFGCCHRPIICCGRQKDKPQQATVGIRLQACR
jgi:hypothetical protein